MNRNLKLEERIQILVLHRQGFNVTQISEQLNCAVKEDTVNYIKCNIMKQEGEKCSLRLKKGVVPHIFLCQKRNMPPPVERMAVVKRQRLALVNEALSEYGTKRSNILEIDVKPTQRSDYEGSPSTFHTNVYEINHAGPSTSHTNIYENNQAGPCTSHTNRATARRWIHRNEEEGSLSDRPRPHPPRKNKPKAGAQNATETQESQASKNKKNNSTNTRSRTSARIKKQPTATTPEKLSEKVDNIPETTETPEPSNTNKSSGTKNNNKRTRTSANNNKQSAVPTPHKLSGKDDKLAEVTEESQSSETNNTSGVSDTNKRRKKETVDVKLPEAEELIASVYKFLQAEYEFLKYYIGDICDISPLTNVLKRTADACGVCKNTVRRIVDKTRAQDDQNVTGAAKLAKLRQQALRVSSLAEEESSSGDSEKEENEEDDNQKMDDDSEIKIEESSSSESDDDMDDEDKIMDNYSGESDECEVEAPDMDIDDHELKPLDPLKSEPVQIMTESRTCTDILNPHIPDPVITQPVEVKTETTDTVHPQSFDPLITQTVEVKAETTDIVNSQCSSDVIPMTSLAPIKTEPEDNCTLRCSSDVIPMTSLTPIKTEPGDNSTPSSDACVLVAVVPPWLSHAFQYS